MSSSFIVGHTERIIVRSWNDSDLEGWINLSQDEGLNQFSISGYRMKNHEEAKAFADKAMKFFEETKLMGAFPIFLQETSKMIGICGLKFAKLDDEPAEKVEIMYRLAQPYWGHGYATEAGQILLDYGFRKLNLSQVIGFILPDNHPSRAVLQRLGMRFVRKSSISKLDIELYEIHAENYLKVK